MRPYSLRLLIPGGMEVDFLGDAHIFWCLLSASGCDTRNLRSSGFEKKGQELTKGEGGPKYCCTN